MTTNTKLRCALVFLGPFPVGNVSTLRIMSYCKALAKKGVFVKVLLIAPTAEAVVNTMRSGIIDGVHYQYVTDITWSKPNPSKISKLFYYILGIVKSVKYLREDKVNCLLSYRSEIIFNLFYRLLTRILNIPFILDKTEYPNSYFKISALRRKIEHLKLRMFDGFITITNELMNFYSHITKRRPSSYFLLPMTVDVDRYKSIIRDTNTKGYIAVMFGTHDRDCLLDSILSYHKYVLLKKVNVLDLYLIGDFKGLCAQFPKNLQITEYIKVNKLEANIFFKGLVPINKIPNILVNATCLLTTPRSYESGGFPTKLGEYLLSGVVVVATIAGEIENYLIDKVNVLLSVSGDISGIADRILFVDLNHKVSLEIGKAGREVANRVFNADTYADSLIKFLHHNLDQRRGKKF